MTSTQSKPLIGLKLAFIQVTFIMFALLLLIDSINGFFLAGIGIDPKLSASYKLLLLVVLLWQIGSYSLRILALILLCIVTLMIGSLISVFSTLDGVGFVDDFITVLKLLTPLIVFIYCALITQYRCDLVLSYGIRCCYISFYIVALNLILGILGFGFASYGVGEIGIKGFFYAGNEVSGLYIVFFGLLLHWAWQKVGKLLYLIMSVLTLIAGLLIATKAAMLAGALLVFAIPIFNERNRLFHLTWLKIKLIFPFVILLLVLSFFLISILESTGIWGRLVWFYEKKGIIGLIFSGRDEFISTGMAAFHFVAGAPEYIFGIGRTGLGLITKESMEVDPIDMFLWFGILGVCVYISLVFVFIKVSYLATLQKNSEWGPVVLLINIVLIAVSIIAGHIFTSGMLGPFIGLINGIAYADYFKNKSLR